MEEHITQTVGPDYGFYGFKIHKIHNPYGFKIRMDYGFFMEWIMDFLWNDLRFRRTWIMEWKWIRF